MARKLAGRVLSLLPLSFCCRRTTMRFVRRYQQSWGEAARLQGSLPVRESMEWVVSCVVGSTQQHTTTASI